MAEKRKKFDRSSLNLLEWEPCRDTSWQHPQRRRPS